MKHKKKKAYAVYYKGKLGKDQFVILGRQFWGYCLFPTRVEALRYIYCWVYEEREDFTIKEIFI